MFACLFSSEGRNKEGKPWILALPAGGWRGWSDGLQEPFQLDSEDSGEQRGWPRVSITVISLGLVEFHMNGKLVPGSQALFLRFSPLIQGASLMGQW